MTPAVILIVEDDPAGRELAKEILDAAGYTVLSAEDGRGLPERAKLERPDLILMDLQLPGIDGLTLVRQLKTDDETRQTDCDDDRLCPAGAAREGPGGRLCRLPYQTL